MCGIVGCITHSNALKPVIEGLSRLEYRGYDSAGVSLKNTEHQEQTFKEEGKLENLKKSLMGKSLNGEIAIGHTRWATHGEVNKVNAHPHGNQDFVIVHNGIIENAFEIKEKLLKEYNFLTNTDTEVFLALLSHYKYTKKKGTIETIASAFKEIKGNSAFVIVSKNENKIFSIKRSAPLVCGSKTKNNKKEFFVSSDPYALIGFVDCLYFPDDGVISEMELNARDICFFNLDGQKTEKYQKSEAFLKWEVSQKGDFEHFMLKEIFEQPTLINRFKNYYLNGNGKKLLENIEQKKFDHIHIVACGTAWHAGLVISKFFENSCNIRVSTYLASEFRYSNPIINKNDLGILISQSGETLDTLAGAELLKSKNVTCYSIINVEGSTLYRECDENFLIQAGQEIGVASTKAFTLMVLTGYLMANSLAGNGISKSIISEIDQLKVEMEKIWKNRNEIEKIATEIYQKNGFIYTGRGGLFPMALEGALKLKEIAYVHAEGYAAGELKHGPIALIDENMVNVAFLGDELFEKTLSNIEEVKARRGKILIFGTKSGNEIDRIADYFVPINGEKTGELTSLLMNMVSQLLSYYIAKFKGHDIDKPRNLAKSVTVE